MARIVVSGYMIRHPVAGMMMAYFHYILGLYRLGHEVTYLEESGWPGSCYDPVAQTYSDDPHSGLDAVQALMNEYDVKGTVCYVNRETGMVYGADWDKVKHILKAADLLVNLGGVCWLPEFHLCQRRVLVDMDPFFTQVGRFAAESLAEHHIHFSYGVNIGHASCAIPTNGVDWYPTVPPVVPEIWQGPMRGQEKHGDSESANAAFTTIANWSAYGGITYRGEHYGQKDTEFLRLLDLPSQTSQRLELALSGAGAETWERLRAAGWSLRGGGEVSIDVPAYRSYIFNSRGEFSVAKNAYVRTRSGWFSDRSVCYLAAGRPVVLQDTGFSRWLPTGRGILAFRSLEEAADCIDRVNATYTAHCRAARETAEKVFSYKVVLPRLIEIALTLN